MSLLYPKIVAFTGPIGAGKTTAANCLCHSLQYKKISFADPLKKMLLAIGCTAEDVYGKDKEIPSILLCGQTPRHAMQTLGTEWGRALIGPDLWVRAWQFACQSHRNVTVDDARFPNEFKVIKELGGIIIKLDRPGVVTTATHESEAYIPEHDYLLANNRGEKDLRLAVIRLIHHHTAEFSI